MKNTSVTIGDLKRHICLVWRFLERKISSSDCSAGDREYTLENLGSVLDKSLITWSYWQWSERISKAFLAKTS